MPHCKINALAAFDVFRYCCNITPANTWTVHMPGGLDIVKWHSDYCMYVKRFDAELINAIDAACSGVDIYTLTVAEREREFPKREVAAAKRARLLQERLYFPSDFALAQSIVKGSYLNCAVTPKDIKLAANIFGFSKPAAAGKTKDMGPSCSHEFPVPVHMRRDQSIFADVKKIVLEGQAFPAGLCEALESSDRTSYHKGYG